MTTDWYERYSPSIDAMGMDEKLAQTTRRWFGQATRAEYSYHFKWLGVPIIQFPQDAMAIQEILWEAKPELVIETGVAHGGSLLLSASVLELLDGPGRVLGIDIDVREHARRALQEHRLAHRIDWLQGDSTDPRIVDEVRRRAYGQTSVVVILDSNHTADHVRRELAAYSGLVTPGAHLIVMDTVIEYMSPDLTVGRPWGAGNSPMTAVTEFLASGAPFDVDREITAKLQITVAPGGYLRRRV